MSSAQSSPLQSNNGFLSFTFLAADNSTSCFVRHFCPLTGLLSTLESPSVCAPSFFLLRCDLDPALFWYTVIVLPENFINITDLPIFVRDQDARTRQVALLHLVLSCQTRTNHQICCVSCWSFCTPASSRLHDHGLVQLYTLCHLTVLWFIRILFCKRTFTRVDFYLLIVTHASDLAIIDLLSGAPLFHLTCRFHYQILLLYHVMPNIFSQRAENNSLQV